MPFARGQLKLKGGLAVTGGGTKKKAKKHKAKKKAVAEGNEEGEGSQMQIAPRDGEGDREGEGDGDGAAEGLMPGDEPKEVADGYHLPPRSSTEDRRTAAERKYDAWLKRRDEKQVGALAKKSHRERIRDFNEYLAKLTEHHDIPKVGPG